MRRANIVLTCALGITWVTALPLRVSAQGANSTDAAAIAALVQKVKELEQHDRDLQERIRVLEGQQRTPVAAVQPEATAPAATPTAENQSQDAQEVAREMHNLSGIKWRGFGEVNYKVLDQRTPELGTYGFVPGSAGNFYSGDFDLFLTSRLNDKTSALSEIDFVGQDAQNFKVDLRRMLLKYDQSDHLRMSFGRYQTNIGYYNWAFRSASWLQTTADRPLIQEFATEGGLLPTQAIGISVTGTIPSGKLGLNYIAEYGSSDTIRPDINGEGNFNDENNGNQINFGLFATPDRFPGLRIGGAIYHDQISNIVLSSLDEELNSSSDRFNQTIFNGHVVYVAHQIEFLNEGFLIRHAPIGPGETFHTPAFYTQFSRKFGKVRPFFRYQYVNKSELNPIFDDITLRHGPSFGARYDLNDFLAFKVQLDRTWRGELPAINGLHLQLSGTF